MTDPLRCGVFDWPRFPGKGGFYPDDLPPEWRLNYYANAFESACLPLTALPVDGELREEWLDSLPEGFRLSLRADDAVAAVPPAEALGAARPGWLIGAGINAPPGWTLRRGEELLWRPGDAEFRPVALLPRADSLRQCREWVESWLALSDEPAAATDLWVDAAATTPQQLEALRQLVELMGL